ncbi:hypothetical protein ACFL6G_03945 [candidate division KSB1 bacterium]
MEDNIQIIVSNCPECNNLIQIKKTAVSIYCMQCKTWLKIVNEKLEKAENGDQGAPN